MLIERYGGQSMLKDKYCVTFWVQIFDVNRYDIQLRLQEFKINTNI